ncbi:hypothetical protein FOA52_010459 [Chlamydomonas sp. UWO 241]|nr:hypothetical protein FOA52_010459 [Chlamydomonas sp. UWO 241]
METRAWLQERHQPVLMVAADPAAEAMCMERNGLSLVDVLRPFSHLTQLQVAFRIGEASLRVRELKVRFHAAATIQQPSPEAIEEHLARRLAAAAAQYATPERDVLVDLMSRRGPPPSVSLTPWYSEYRDEFLRLLRFGCHETLDHPVGALLVVPAGVPNAVSAFEALMVDPSAMPAAMRPAPTERQQPQQVQSPPPPPPQQQQQQQQQAGGGGGDGGGGASASGSGAGGGGKGGTGSGAGGCGLGHGSGPHVEWMYPVRDRDFARHYVLLLDGSVPPDAALNKRAADNIAACREVFGQEHVSLLRINTAKGGPECAGALPTFYRSFQRTGLPGGVAGDPEYLLPVPAAGLGAALSAVDLDSISATIRRAVGQSVLPMLERRINRLNDGITAARRGLRNRLTRMWKAAADDTVVDRPYPWHSIEGQMRQLADLAFLLQHFEFAASVYRLAAQDYLAHNNLRWYAGAEEMISLCCVLDPSDGSDPLKYSTRAYEHYSRLPGKLPRMLASRAMMLCALYQSSAGRHLSANHVLMRAHFELSDRFGLLEAVPPEGADAQAEYDAMAAAIHEVATNHLAPRGSRRRRGWQFTLSQRTLRLMDARQRAHTAWLRSKSAAAKRERNRANRAADAAVQRDRERWIGQQVAEAQDMLRKKNLRQFARACDRLAGRSRSHQIPPAMRDVSGALHSGPDGVLKAMTESFDKLYGGETKLSDETLNQLENDVAAFELTRATEVDEAHGRPPDLAETEACVRALRSAAAPGGDQLDAMLLRCPPAIAWLHRVIIAVWRSGREC